MSDPTIGVGYLLGLAGLIAAGAVLPFVPTGAAVSAAAAVAAHDHITLIVLVILAGGAGAYVGDLGIYGILRLASTKASEGQGVVGRWLVRRRRGHALEHVDAQLREHDVRTLLLSRLVPGGQVPVLLAAAVDAYSWRRYAITDIAAAGLWSVTYAVTGLAGRAVFPRTWEGVAAGIALIVVLSGCINLWERLRPR